MTVLVATTDSTTACALHRQLRALGCRVVIAGTAEQAAAAMRDAELGLVAAAFAPDVLRSAPAIDVAVILDDEGSMLGFVRAGAFDVLHQPVCTAELASVVERARGRRRPALASDPTSDLAHAIASPLTYVLGNAISAYEEVQRPRFDLDDLKAMLADVKDGAERIREVVRQLRSGPTRWIPDAPGASVADPPTWARSSASPPA